MGLSRKCQLKALASLAEISPNSLPLYLLASELLSRGHLVLPLRPALNILWGTGLTSKACTPSQKSFCSGHITGAECHSSHYSVILLYRGASHQVFVGQGEWRMQWGWSSHSVMASHWGGVPLHDCFFSRIPHGLKMDATAPALHPLSPEGGVGKGWRRMQ